MQKSCLVNPLPPICDLNKTVDDDHTSNRPQVRTWVFRCAKPGTTFPDLTLCDWQRLEALISDDVYQQLVFLSSVIGYYVYYNVLESFLVRKTVTEETFWCGGNTQIAKHCVQRLQILTHRLSTPNMWSRWFTCLCNCARMPTHFGMRADVKLMCASVAAFSTQEYCNHVCSRVFRHIESWAAWEWYDNRLSAPQSLENVLLGRNSSNERPYFIVLNNLNVLEFFLSTVPDPELLYDRPKFPNFLMHLLIQRIESTKLRRQKVIELLLPFLPRDVCTHVVAPFIACVTGRLFGKT